MTVPMSLTKALSYAKFKRATNVCFCLFSIAWIVSRLIIFPFSIIFVGMFDVYPAVFLFIVIFFGLLIIHIIWTHKILQILIKGFADGGGIEKSVPFYKV